MNNIPDYIMNFIEAVYPEDPELSLATFNEKLTLIEATNTIIDLRNKVECLNSNFESARNAFIQLDNHPGCFMNPIGDVSYETLRKFFMDCNKGE